MKVFILCGGFGTRLDYEGKIKAKPMVEIGKKPILMHSNGNFKYKVLTSLFYVWVISQKQ